MDLIKATWRKKRKPEVGVEVLDKIAARGSFVIVRSSTLYKEIMEGQPQVERAQQKLDRSRLAEEVNKKTRELNLKMWMENLADNIPVIKTCKDISHIPKATRRSAIVVGAGPSFKAKGHMEILRKVKNQAIISTDRMLIPLLSAGISPDLVVSLDGDRERIVKWYDNRLVDENRTTIGVMAVVVAPNVVRRFPGEKFFFTPMIGEPDSPSSLSKAIGYMTRTPIISSGGNVGVTCAILAFYLGYKIIILTGLDLGYTMETPIEESAYFPVVKEAAPTMDVDEFRELFLIYGYNPDFDVRYYTDIVFKHHRDYLVEISEIMAKNGTTIINATEGGSVHGGAIVGLPLREAIRRYE